MTKSACLLLRIYVRRENTQTGIQLCFNLVFTTASQKSNLIRKIYVFRLFPTEWMFPRLALTLCQAKIVLCFLHEWKLPPSDVTDNGGNVGGKNGGDVPGLSLACPQLSHKSCHKLCHKLCHKTKKRMQVLMQKMQSPVQRVQVWRTMDEIAQFTNRDKDYIRNPIDSQKDFNSYV